MLLRQAAIGASAGWLMTSEIKLIAPFFDPHWQVAETGKEGYHDIKMTSSPQP